MSNQFNIGEHVQIRLPKQLDGTDNWLSGTIVRIEPYSEHRSFHWVKLDEEARVRTGIREISVFNPRHIRKSNPTTNGEFSKVNR